MAKKSMINKSQRKPKFEVRRHNRCLVCGRPRSYYRYFKICRCCLRKYALEGIIPGITKSSW
ncbi:MAG: type Z 30S ribosomal protein S14 [bacterium]|jgi:small subunit ribosomal protein S14